MFEQTRGSAGKAMDRAKCWAREHQPEIRAAANAGIYTIGCVVLYKATTLVGVLAGAAAVCLGGVGLGASAAELVAGSAAEPLRFRTSVPNA